ncbi:MAG: NADH-quinone oxidoreductase subunit L [Candidatus Solibacter usitatus]|nr:NADH-quinone oxidoreductase subunit L [Candidatus Solibacter usitatus]
MQDQQLWLIPALPLVGFLINGLLGRRFPKALVNVVALGSVLFSFAWVLKTFNALGGLETAHVERYFSWIQSGSLDIGFDLSVDRLTAVMLLVVTGIGSLIHIYATGYMSHEGGYYRFFAYLNLFMFFMLTLVLGNNFLVMFVGWEGVGLCSYLLIGFYTLKKSAGDAAKKAFIVNRIGDFGFALAMFLMVVNFGSLDFQKVFAAVKPMPVEQTAGLLTAIALLLFVGATGKSAQVPLYVWLPDAMEGPTPVSALIHAATMVTAGVYMTARSAVIFQHSPMAMDVVAIVGVITAVMAATIGITQFDIKKVFAYSTVSQLGYMFIACGVGAFSAGIYHVVTHAFFKALLFLGAGSVIHALGGEQDLRHMGGLWKKIPITFGVLACAWVAISGVPPFAGFYSKDEILLAAHHHAPWMYWVGVVTAGMTAFYVSRAIFMCFFGDYRGHHHPHESPVSMWGPLAVLALLSLAGGMYFKVPHYLEPMFPAAEGHHDETLVMISVAAGLLGIGIAALLYVVRPGLPDTIAAAFGPVYKLVYNKYFVDEIYDAAIVNPLVGTSRSFLWRVMDAGIIDGIVNGTGFAAKTIGGGLRLLQSGNIRSYAAWVTAGCVLVLLAIGVVAGGVR